MLNYFNMEEHATLYDIDVEAKVMSLMCLCGWQGKEREQKIRGDRRVKFREHVTILFYMNAAESGCMLIVLVDTSSSQGVTAPMIRQRYHVTRSGQHRVEQWAPPSQERQRCTQGTCCRLQTLVRQEAAIALHS